MRRTLVVVGLTALASIGAVLAWRWDRQNTHRLGTQFCAEPLDPGSAYVVDVNHDQADIDLDFQADSRFVLVVSSLARTTGSFSVAASCQPVRAPQFLPRLLTPEPPRVPTSGGTPMGQNTKGAMCSAAGTPAIGLLRSSPESMSDAHSSAGEGRSFSLHVTDGSLDDPHQYAKVAAHEVARGRQVRVYLDDHQLAKDLAPGLIESIADLFDKELIPRFQAILGTYRDVDGDGRFSVLLTPWLARLQGGRTSIGGFVRGSDFQPRIAPPFSNRCDMMYVNSETVPGPHLRTLLIHEYTHAVAFSRRTAVAPGQTAFPEEEDWLNEALAHCAETLFDGGWTNLDYRISRYLNDTASYPLVVEDYYRAGLWRCHGCRGATYLFLRYCVERFGAQTLAQLIATPARGTRNLELATGCSFDRLFRDWTLSLVTSGNLSAAKTSQSQPRDAVHPGSSRPHLADLDLYGALGPWSLAGPRPRTWEIGRGPMTIDLKGTSAAFVEVLAPPKPGCRRIHLAGTQGMQLQVSLVRPYDDSHQLHVDAAWLRRATADSSGVGETAAGNDERIRIAVHWRPEANASIERIAAEQNIGEERVPLCFSGNSVKSIEVAVDRAASTCSVPRFVSEPICRVFELPAAQFSQLACPVIVKVVARDCHGRRIVGWASITERAQQVAAIAQPRQ
jgi:hypothetical protein